MSASANPIDKTTGVGAHSRLSNENLEIAKACSSAQSVCSNRRARRVETFHPHRAIAPARGHSPLQSTVTCPEPPRQLQRELVPGGRTQFPFGQTHEQSVAPVHPVGICKHQTLEVPEGVLGSWITQYWLPTSQVLSPHPNIMIPPAPPPPTPPGPVEPPTDEPPPPPVELVAPAPVVPPPTPPPSRPPRPPAPVSPPRAPPVPDVAPPVPADPSLADPVFEQPGA